MKKREKSSNLFYKVIIILLLLLVCLSVSLMFMFKTPVTESLIEGIQNIMGNVDKGGLDTKGYDVVKNELQEESDKSKISFKINTAPSTQSDGKIDWMIENKDGNLNSIQVVFTTQDGKVIYTTPEVKPGYSISKAPMDVTLAKGEYTVLATINVYEPVKKALLGKTGVNVKLTIK